MIRVSVDDLICGNKRHCGCRHGADAVLTSGINNKRQAAAARGSSTPQDNAKLLRELKELAARWAPMTVVKLISSFTVGGEKEHNNTRIVTIEDVASGKKLEVAARSYGAALEKIRERLQ